MTHGKLGTALLGCGDREVRRGGEAAVAVTSTSVWSTMSKEWPVDPVSVGGGVVSPATRSASATAGATWKAFATAWPDVPAAPRATPVGVVPPAPVGASADLSEPPKDAVLASLGAANARWI